MNKTYKCRSTRRPRKSEKPKLRRMNQSYLICRKSCMHSVTMAWRRGILMKSGSPGLGSIQRFYSKSSLLQRQSMINSTSTHTLARTSSLQSCIRDSLPNYVLFQMSKDLLGKIGVTPEEKMLELMQSDQEFNTVVTKAYYENAKLRQSIRKKLVAHPQNVALANTLLANAETEERTIFNAYSPAKFDNETQLCHWVIYDCSQHGDHFEMTKLIISMFKKNPETLGNETVFKKIVLPHFLLVQSTEVNERDLRFLLRYLAQFPQTRLNISEINAFTAKANSVRKQCPQLNRQCLSVAFNLNHAESFSQKTSILNYYDQILQDVASSNTAAVALGWEQLLKIEPDLTKHNSYIIYHLLKAFRKSKMYHHYGKDIFAKLYPHDYYLKQQSLIGPFLHYAILLNDMEMAQNIITTISKNIAVFTKFNISKYYSQLLLLHLSFNDSEGTSNIISKILSKTKNNVLPPYDLEIIIRHILRKPGSDYSVVSGKIQEAIYLFEKTVKHLKHSERVNYYTNCYPHIIKTCLEVLKGSRDSLYEITAKERYLKTSSIINKLFGNVQTWTPKDKKPPRAFQQSISSMYFDFLTDCKARPGASGSRYAAQCLETAQINYITSLNELENKTVAPQNPFNINQAPAVETKLIVNYANRLVILKNILKNSNKQKNQQISRWCVQQLKTHMGRDSYNFEQKLLKEQKKQRNGINTTKKENI